MYVHISVWSTHSKTSRKKFALHGSKYTRWYSKNITKEIKKSLLRNFARKSWFEYGHAKSLVIRVQKEQIDVKQNRATVFIIFPINSNKFSSCEAIIRGKHVRAISWPQEFVSSSKGAPIISVLLHFHVELWTQNILTNAFESVTGGCVHFELPCVSY